MPRSQQARSGQRREEILEAALACFAELGYDKAKLEDVRQRSGASTGSIYHHFGGKERLAAAVYLHGLKRYHRGFLDVLARHSDAEAGIRALVDYHLRWCEGEPDWARFLFLVAATSEVRSLDPGIGPQIEAFSMEVGRWFGEQTAAGRLRALPQDLVISAVMGPVQDFARQLLAGTNTTDVGEASQELGELTWSAIRRPKELMGS